MNFVRRFGVTDSHNLRVEKSLRIESLFTVVVTNIFNRESGAIEHLFRIGKVKAILFQIGCLDSRHVNFMVLSIHMNIYTSAKVRDRLSCRISICGNASTNGRNSRGNQ